MTEIRNSEMRKTLITFNVTRKVLRGSLDKIDKDANSADVILLQHARRSRNLYLAMTTEPTQGSQLFYMC
jgi:hypothetical protein